ncbi:MAG TPA: inositol monophosphatase [Candidatus Woesebacteria bacterium]|nr:inositol monophosphatase [Candidatus Woesebacteria bacterium]
MFDLLNNTAHKAGEILLTYFRQETLNVSHKTSHHNIVTQADTEAQAVIHKLLIEGMQEKGIDPTDVGFIGEEKLSTEMKEHMFIIDPLDGTANFATGLELFCVLIGYMRNGKVEAGIIYMPVHGDIYFAEKGKGAFLMRRGIKLPLKIDNADTTNGFLSSYLGEGSIEKRMPEKLARLQPDFRGIRLIGAGGVSFAYLSENIFDTVILGHCGLWDFVGPQIIIEEAGGIIYDWQGNEIVYDFKNPFKPYELIASHPSFKKQIVEKMKS